MEFKCVKKKKKKLQPVVAWLVFVFSFHLFISPQADVVLSVSSQLFWEKKLSGLNAFDIAEELVKTMELPKGLQGKFCPFFVFVVFFQL